MSVSAACCRCAQWFVVSDEGVGFDRHYCGLCGRCRAEVGDLDAALAGIDRALQGLAQDSPDMHRRWQQAIDRANDAWNRLWGVSGSASRFFQGIASMAVAGEGLEGAPSALGVVGGIVTAVAGGVGSTGQTPEPSAAETTSGAGAAAPGATDAGWVGSRCRTTCRRSPAGTWRWMGPGRAGGARRTRRCSCPRARTTCSSSSPASWRRSRGSAAW